MSRLGWFVAAAAITALACSGEDPPTVPPTPAAADRQFAPGSEAMIVSASGSDGILMTTAEGRGSLGDMESIDSGTKVRIVSEVADEGKTPDRSVQVMILDGKHAGLPGTVRRTELKPLP